MDHACLNAGGRTTIPKAIREAARLRDGDVLAFSIEGNRVILRKAEVSDDAYRATVSATFTEWESPEDEAA